MSENYIPLYRKYRPKNLAEVVGQEHVKKALSNAISLNKISHAYLFAGSRGTGKTSIARIFAKSLNCDKGQTLTPCEVCPSCINITNSGQMDVIEIDAASNRKVEEIESNILGKVLQAREGKYKIYIIDEVHMLTTHAFNALLKTLEEPPENVIFILATTEPHKILETITSRCQRFDFKRITTEDIVNHLKKIAELEKININEDALYTIAKNAAGGMRDALAFLDQASVLGSSSDDISTEDINKLLGRLSFDTLNKLAEFMINSQPQEAIELLENIYNSGNEPTQILINLLGYLKNLLIVKNCTKTELLMNLTQLNESQIKALKTQAELIETHQITFLTEKTTYYIKELKTTTNQHLWLEIAIIDLANLTENTSLLELQNRISRLESGGAQPQAAPIKTYSPARIEAPKVSAEKEPERSEAKPEFKAKEIEKVEKIKEEKPEKVKKEESDKREVQEPTPESSNPPSPQDEDLMPVSKPAEKDSLNELWVTLLQNISSTPTVSLLTQHTRPIEISEDKIIIGCRENFLKLLSSDSKKLSIEEGAKKIFNKTVAIIIKSATINEATTTEKKNSIIEKISPKNATPTTSESTPPEENNTEIDEEDEFVEHELAKKKEKKIVASDQVNMVMQLFDGKFID